MIDCQSVFQRNYQLFSTIMKDWPCPDRSAVKCSLIDVNFDVALEPHFALYDIPSELEGEVAVFVFQNVLRWEIKGQYLSEFRTKTRTTEGYMIITHNKYNGFNAFYEINGYKFSIRENYGVLILFQWNVLPKDKISRTVHPSELDRQQDEFLDNIAYCYESINWVYETKAYEDEYRFNLLKGVQFNNVVNVSIAFYIDTQVYQGLGLNNPMGIQLVAAFLTKQLQKATSFSKIPIQWKIHCIGFHELLHKNETEYLPELDPAHYLSYYNSFKPGDRLRKRVHSADVAVIIKRDIGDRDAVAIFNGIQYGKTTIMLKEAFALGKYNFIRSIGHMIGCGNEAQSSIGMEPAMFMARSFIMKNGYCGVMASQINRSCKPELFFSNPEKKFDGEPTGHFYANNAIWIKHNRYALAYAGNEALTCPIGNMYNSSIIDCFMSSHYANINCDDAFSDYNEFL